MFNRSKKIDRILTKCILSIEKKGWTIDDCLNRYPDYRNELETMLQTAMRLRRGSRFRPSADFRKNAQSRIHLRIQSSRRSPRISTNERRPVTPKITTSPPHRTHLATLAPLILISLAIIVTGGGIAFAADSARPGEALFQVDRTIEHLRIMFENDVQQTVRLHLQFADERLQELIELIRQGNTKDLSSALSEYLMQIVATAPLIQQAQLEGEDVNALIIETSKIIDAQEVELQNLLAHIPIEYQSAIQDTIDDAEEVREMVISPIPTEGPMVEITPEPFVFEPELPSPKPPTYPAPTVMPTRRPTNVPTIKPPSTPIGAPPAITNTPGAFILPTNTIPIPVTPTPMPSITISPSPTPGTSTPTPTPTRTATPTPTPSRTPTKTGNPKPGPTEIVE